MKILVVSDTHKDYERYFNVVLKNPADYYVHLGDGSYEFAEVAAQNPDKDFIFVKGDTDYCNASSTQIIDAGKCRILCTHGNEQNVGQGLDELVMTAKLENCNVALYGHTHLYRTDLIDGVYVMNPGSLGTPRGRNKPSFGVLEIDASGTVKMNIVAY